VTSRATREPAGMEKEGIVVLEGLQTPKQYSKDVEGTIDPVRVIILRFPFFLILLFLCFIIYSFD
jgi:hypothetical protein